MMPQPSARLRAAVAQVGPVQTRRPVRDWTATLGALALTGIAAVGVLGLRRDLAQLPPAYVGGLCALWLLGVAGLSRLALVPPAGQVLARARRTGVFATLFGGGCVLAGLGLAVQAPSSTIVAGDFATFSHYAVSCFTVGIAVATGPVLVALWCGRGTAPLHTRWLAAGIGAAGGALGGLVLHLHCPIANPDHLGIAHGGVPLLAAAVAAVVGVVVLDRRR